MGLIIASLFWQLDQHKFLLKFGVLIFSAIFLGFSATGEVPSIIHNRNVATRQIRAGMYDAVSYVVSSFVVGLPMSVLATCIFASVTYWLVDLANDAGRFFVFLGVLLLAGMMLGSFFRMVALGASAVEVAQAGAMPFVIVFLVFSGGLFSWQHPPAVAATLACQD